MAEHFPVPGSNSDRQQNLLHLEHQLRSKLRVILHAFSCESEYQRQALVAAVAEGGNAVTFIPTAKTHHFTSVAEAFLRASKPIVISGPSGCGKSALIDYLARQHGRVSPPHIYKVQLAAETDARALLGSYHITSSLAPSAATASAASGKEASSLCITWLPGLLSVAVIEGAWLVLENIDCAPLEVLSVLTPVLDSGRLYIAEEGRNLHCAPGFRIFATSRTMSASGTDGGNFSSLPLSRHFQHINMQMPEITDCEHIITKRFASAKSYAKAIMRIYAAVLEMSTGQLYLTNEYAASSVPRSQNSRPNSSAQPKRLIKRHINLRDLVKLCQRLDQRLPSQSNGESSGAEKDISLDDHAETENDTTVAEDNDVSDLSSLLFTEALDVFCMNISNYDDFIYAAQRIGSLLSFSNSQVQRQLSFSDGNCQPKYVDFCTVDRVYKHLKVGRSKLAVDSENMRKRASSLKSLPQSSIAWHSQTICIVNAAAAAVSNREPLLLVGETGTGKTSIVQYLAEASCNQLRVLNMSHYSESSDLIGGYKPLPRRSFFARLLKTVIPLIEKTFKTMPNTSIGLSTTRSQRTETTPAVSDDHHRVEAVLTKAFDAENYRAVVKYIKLVCERALTKLNKSNGFSRKNSTPDLPNGTSGTVDSTTGNAEAQKSMLVSLWREAILQVQTAEQTLVEAAAANGGRAHISFAFLEGAVVNALKTGEWLLLDEINLASSDALQCLLQLLDSKSSSLVLTERGDRHALNRHANFRLFACMNPSTDVGKRDLEAGIRNRFTEIFVQEDLSHADLEKLVVFYMSNWLTSPEDPLINKLVKFYVETLALVRKGKLLDSTGKRPHFGIRSFCQALRLASRDTLRFKKRSLYEALCLRFLTQLDGTSTRLMEDKIQKLVFGASLSAARIVSMLSKVPPLPEGLAKQDEAVLVENFWISRGALEPHEQKWFVLTKAVRQNLCSLARAVALGRYPVLLQGETSIGKTSLVRYLAELTGNECLRINNHEHTDLDDYIGSYQMDDVTGEMVFREGPLVDAVRRGYWIILDELNLAAPDVLEALNRLLDDNRELYIAETGDVVKAHPRFMLFATQNPAGGAYAGRKLLSRAFRSRFVELHFSELPDDELINILQQRCSLPSSYAKKLVGVLQQLHRIRSKGSVLSGKQSFITMRDLFRWAERYRRSDAESSLLVKRRDSTVKEVENLDPVAPAKSGTNKKKQKLSAAATLAATVVHDWDQYLADHGYLLLAGRVRDAGEDEAIRDVLFKVFSRRVDVASLFGYIPADSNVVSDQNQIIPDQFGTSSRTVVKAILDHHHQQHTSSSAVEQEQFRHIVWTNMLRRMLVLSATALYFDEPILLIGGTGLGKTTLCQMLASWSDNIMQTVNCHMHSETADFIGSLRPVRRSDGADSAVVEQNQHDKKSAKLFEWQNGPLVEAMSFGRFFLLDEINLAEDSVLERINSVLETDKTLVLTEKGTSTSASSVVTNGKKHAQQQQRSTLEIIKAQPTFRLVATMNPGGDFGKRELSPALRNRFSEIWCGSENDMSDDDSVRILRHNMQPILQRFSLPLTAQALIASAMLDTVRIVQYGAIVAEAKTTNKPSSFNTRPLVLVSVRELLAWTQFIRAYVDMMNAGAEAASSGADLNKNSLLEGIVHGAFICVLDAATHATSTSLSSNDDELTQKAFRSLLTTLIDTLQIADNMRTTVYETIYNEAMMQIPPPVVDDHDIIGIRPFLLRKAPRSLGHGASTESVVDKTFYYQVPTVRQNLLSMLRGMLLNKPILLEGPPGVGKTALVTALTHATGRQLVRINLSEQTDLAELFGADLPVESSTALADDEDDCSTVSTPISPKSNTVDKASRSTNTLFAWRDGPLLQALKCGAWILLDELNLASQAVLEGLNAVLDHRGIIYVPELNRSFQVPADASVRIFATQNPYASGHGRKGLPRSFLNRFVKVYCRELMPSDVHAICRHACPGVDSNQLDKMVKFAEYANKSTSHFVDDESKFNLRDILRWCQLVQRYSLSSIDCSEAEKSRISVEFLPMLYLNRLPNHSASKSTNAARKAFDLPKNFQFPTFSAQDVHLNITNTFVQIGRVLALRGLDAPFVDDDDETTSASFSSDRRTVLTAQRLLLQDMATCVAMRWPVVLSGKHSTGKRTLVRTLSQLHNKRLEVMALNAATDTFELIGGFEQAHLSRQVENFFDDLLECCTISSRTVMYGRATVRVRRHRQPTAASADENIDIADEHTDDNDAAEQRLYDMADHLVRKSFELLGLLKQENYLYQRTSSSSNANSSVTGWKNVFEPRLSTSKLQLADEMLSLIASMTAIAEFSYMPSNTNNTYFDPVEHNVEQLRRRFYRLRKLSTYSSSTTPSSQQQKTPATVDGSYNNSKSGFEWVDSPLLRAMKRGYWILLENVNMCSPAVLDRLNSVFEPDGKLLISERGAPSSANQNGDGGGLFTITPHPEFRAFFTVDFQRVSSTLGGSASGELKLSRAMRNRTVELFVPDPFSAPSSAGASTRFYPAWTKTDLVAALTLSGNTRSTSPTNGVLTRLKLSSALVDNDDFMESIGQSGAGGWHSTLKNCDVRSIVDCLDVVLSNNNNIADAAEIAAEALVAGSTSGAARTVEHVEKTKQLFVSACTAAAVLDKQHVCNTTHLTPRSLAGGHLQQPPQMQLLDLLWRLSRTISSEDDEQVAKMLTFFMAATLPRSFICLLLDGNSVSQQQLCECFGCSRLTNADKQRLHLRQFFDAVARKFASRLPNTAVKASCTSLAIENDFATANSISVDVSELVPLTGDLLWNRQLLRAAVSGVETQQQLLDSSSVHAVKASVHLLLLHMALDIQPSSHRTFAPSRRVSKALLLLSNDAVEQQFLESISNLSVAVLEAAAVPFETDPPPTTGGGLDGSGMFAVVLWIETIVKMLNAVDSAENANVSPSIAFGGRDALVLLAQQLRVFVAWSILQRHQVQSNEAFGLISADVAQRIQLLLRLANSEPFFVALQQQQTQTNSDVSYNNTVALLAKFYHVVVPKWCQISITREHFEYAVLVRKCAMYLTGLREIAGLQSVIESGSIVLTSGQRIMATLSQMFDGIMRCAHTVDVKTVLDSYRNCADDDDKLEDAGADDIKMQEDLPVESAKVVDADELEQHLIRAVTLSLIVQCSSNNRFANLEAVKAETLRKFTPLSLPFTSFSRLLDVATAKYLRQTFIRLTSSVLPSFMCRLDDGRIDAEPNSHNFQCTKRSLVLQTACSSRFFRTSARALPLSNGDRSSTNEKISSKNETDCVLTCAPLTLARLPLRSFSSSISTAKQLLSMCRFTSAAAAVEFDAEADGLLLEVQPLCAVVSPAVSNQLSDDDSLDNVAKLKLICTTFSKQLDLVLFHQQDKRPALNFTAVCDQILSSSTAASMALVHTARTLYGILVVILSGFHPVPITSGTTTCFSFVFHQLDPALRQRVELELYAEQLKNVEAKLRAHSILSQALFGAETGGRMINSESIANELAYAETDERHPFLTALDRMSHRLRQEVSDRQQNSVAYRPEPLALAKFLQLKADISDYFGTTIAAANNVSSTDASSSSSGFVASAIAMLQCVVDAKNELDSETLDDFARWRKLTYSFIDTVLQPFSTAYNDLVLPLATGLHDTLDSISALLQLKSATPSPPPLGNMPLPILALSSLQTSQFHMNRAMQFLRSGTASVPENESLTLHLLGMSSLAEQLRTSCMKTDSAQARHLQSNLVRQLIKCWTQACDNVRAKRAEQQQLFKVKHSVKPEEQDLQTAYAERDRIAEESDYRQAFPSYEKDYADLRLTTRRNFGASESGGGDADSEREQAVRALSQHEKDVRSLMTLSDRVIRFITECDAFAHSSSHDTHRSPNHAVASENAAFAAYSFYTEQKALQNNDADDSALAALYFQASMLLRHSSSSSSKMMLKNDKNFYHDADTSIALRCASTINSFTLLFDQLEKPEELGGISLAARHPVVEHLRTIFQRILQIPVASSAPVQFAVGLQLVVETVQALLQQIPRGAGLHARVDDLVQFLFELRKMELTSWQRSSSARREELENRAYSWYFRFYTLLEDEATALAAVAGDEKQSSKKLYGFAQAVLTFVDTSPLVEFKPRLLVLDAVIRRASFSASAVVEKQKCAALTQVIDVLHNIFTLYKQFSTVVDATIERCPDADAAKAVKELKDYLKICRYDDRNFWAMRESIEKSRRLVHRCVRKYEVFLMSRALDWTTTAESHKNDSLFDAEQRLPIQTTIDSRLFSTETTPSSANLLLRYVTRANELADKIDSHSSRRTVLLRQRSVSFVTNANDRLQKLQALRFEDLIDSAKMPAEVMGTTNNKEHKAARKQIKTERRRAARAIRRQKVDGLHDLLAVLQQLGVSFRKGLLVTSDDLLMAALKCKAVSAKTAEASSFVKSANAEYYAVLADFGKFRARSMQRIADERLRASISPYVECMRGYAHHAMWLTVKQRAHIVKMANAVDSLQRIDEILGPISDFISNSTAAESVAGSSSLLVRQADFRKLYNSACRFVSTCAGTINELSMFTATCLKSVEQQSAADEQANEAVHKIMAEVAGIKFVPHAQLMSTMEKVDKVFSSLCTEAKQVCAEFASYGTTDNNDAAQTAAHDADDNAPPTLLSAKHLKSLEKAVTLARQLSQLNSVRSIVQSTLMQVGADVRTDDADEPPFIWLNNTLAAVAETSSRFVQDCDDAVFSADGNVPVISSENDAEAMHRLQSDAAELNKNLVQPIMLVVEAAYKTASLLLKNAVDSDSDEADDAGLLSHRYADEIELPLQALAVDAIVPQCIAMVEANKQHYSLDQLRLLSKTLSVVRVYNKVLRSKLGHTLAVHERTCRTLRFSMQVFMLILQRGFCEPHDLLAEDSDDDENEEDSKSKQKKLQKDDEQLNSDQLINEQAGIGDGIGLNDVSNQIKSEDEMKQLLDAEEKPSESTSNQQEKGSAEKESDNAVEMKQHNFEGEYFDEDENAAEDENGEPADKQQKDDGGEKDEPHREMGELGDGLHDVLNDEIWSADDEDKEKPAEENKDDSSKKPLANEQNAGQGKPLDENEDEQMPDEAAAAAEGEDKQQETAAASKNQQNVAGNSENAATVAAGEEDAANEDDDEADAAAQQQPTKLPETSETDADAKMPADEIVADNNKPDHDADMQDADSPSNTLDEGEQIEADETDADGFTDQSIQKQQELDETEMNQTNDDKTEALPIGGSTGQTDADQKADDQQQQNAAHGAYGGLHAPDRTNDQQQQDGGGGASAEDAQNDENANDADEGGNAQLAESAGGNGAANKFAMRRRQLPPNEKPAPPQKRSALPPSSDANRRALASKNDIESGPTPPKRAKILPAGNNSNARDSNKQPPAGDAGIQSDIYQHFNGDNDKPGDSASSLAIDIASQEEADSSRDRKLPPEASDPSEDAETNENSGVDPDEDVRMEEIDVVEKLLAKKTFSATLTKTTDENVAETAAKTDESVKDEQKNDESAASGAASSVVRSDARSTFFTQLDNSQAQIEARERLLAEIVDKMNSWQMTSAEEENADERSRLQHAARLWQLYEQLTAPLARELCEQLRLVLEPTLRGKLRGDFRTGKRLNVRRIIGYIASDFRKDKIWLRRAHPSKRHYQVMLAVDDSQSMAELKTRTMAFEALATLSNALTWLEVGELGVCKFGEQFETLHELGGAPFTTESACRVLARCQFSQRNTRIVQLVDSAMAVFDNARSRIQQQAGRGGAGGLVSQLLLIVSDGHNIFADGEEKVLSSVRAAVSTPGVCIVYIVLRNPAHNVSVLDMKRSVFDKDNKVTLTNYMDDFPFPLYVILNDSSELPVVLGDAIKQWFEMLVSEGV